MKPVDQDRVMSVLAEAVELPPAQRAGFLDLTCAGEPDLRREVEELLTCADPAASVFDAAAQHIVQPDPDRIGSYEILEPIGEGGMAVVYRAQQHHPVRRTVAIKLIKLGMDTRQFVARFESERQALALMDHPNVARVYDAGSTDTGRPYFVMEYVAGAPLLDYCDAHHLDLRQRLELFAVVCKAVEHAHRKGIIHRDLKNSNVLVAEVDGRAVPKVIDFGVAKTIQQPLTDRALQTEQGQMIGTPEYMSPEQAERGGLDVDTRTDVYSLGVLLYELIAGVHPIAWDLLRTGSYEEVQRIIRETEAQRPSTRLSALAGADAASIAQRRRTALPTLLRNLRRELEWIPLKAMRKDREQRYRSASELADDVGNYLDGRPLIAGPETTGYRLRKFLRRNRAAVAAGTTIVVLLIGGIVATSLQAMRAARAEDRAVVERDHTAAMLEFLTNRVLAGATPERIPDATVREQIVKAMIIPASESIGESFKDRPLIEAGIRQTMQTVLMAIGRNDLALPHAEAALSIRQRELGDDHRETIGSLSNYALVLKGLGRVAEAEPVYELALKRSTSVLGADHPDTIVVQSHYAQLLLSLGRAAEAAAIYEKTLEHYRRNSGADHPEAIRALNDYAIALKALDRTAQAEPMYKEALERCRRVYGEDHPRTISSLNNYAAMLRSLGRLAEAEPLFKEALERSNRVLGQDHPDTTTSLNNYAAVLQAMGRVSEARPLFAQALERNRRALGDDHAETAMSLHNYAATLPPEQSEPIVRQSYQTFRRQLGDDHPNTIAALRSWARVLLLLGRPVEAEPLARRAVAQATHNTSLGHNHTRTKSFAMTHADTLDALGRHDEAAAVRADFSLSDPTTAPAAQSSRLPASDARATSAPATSATATAPSR